MSTATFKMPETFESFEIMNAGRMKDCPCNTMSGTRSLIPLLKDAMQACRERYCFTKDTQGADQIVEVGSWAGGNAFRMATLLPSARIHCVDHWKGSESDVTSLIAGELGPRTIFQGFCKNMGDLLFDRVFPCVGSSATWAAVWPRQAAAIYIDAGHDYSSVTQDLNAWWPHVLPGGVLCGHDYEMFEGVKRAVHDWHKPEYGILETDEQLWWVRKI